MNHATYIYMNHATYIYMSLQMIQSARAQSNMHDL